MARVGLTDKLKEENKRPLEALIRNKEEIKKEEIENIYRAYKEAKRKTFVMDPISIEALRIFTYKNRKGLSEALTDMLLKYIPRDIWTEARNNIIDIDETPKDYLEDVEILDIDSIYYHKR